MRKLISSLLALMLVFSLSITAFAAENSVTYDGKAHQFTFKPGSDYSTTDLFSEFKDVMPGDTLHDQIVIKNTRLFSKHLKVYMRSKGAQNGTDDFLKQMTLTVKADGKGTKSVFDGPANVATPINEWIYLGTVYSRGQITLDLTLNVSPEMDSTFAEYVGYIDWEFKVEEIPHDPDSPKTGDYIMTAVAVMAVAAAGLAVLFVVYKRRRKNEQ